MLLLRACKYSSTLVQCSPVFQGFSCFDRDRHLLLNHLTCCNVTRPQEIKLLWFYCAQTFVRYLRSRNQTCKLTHTHVFQSIRGQKDLLLSICQMKNKIQQLGYLLQSPTQTQYPTYLQPRCSQIQTQTSVPRSEASGAASPEADMHYVLHKTTGIMEGLCFSLLLQ